MTKFTFCCELSRAAVYEAGGIPPLVALLAAASACIKEHGLGALTNLTSRSELIRTAVYEAGGIPFLVGLLGPATLYCIIKHAVSVLRNLTAFSEPIRTAVHEARGISALVRLVALLGAETSHIVEAAAGALQNLAACTESGCTEPINAVHKAGGIPPLLGLLRTRQLRLHHARRSGVVDNCNKHSSEEQPSRTPEASL